MIEATGTMGISDQLADKLREAILQGKWAVGSQMPSTRQLAKQYGVSVNTVQNVLRALSVQGLIDLQPRRRGLVRSNAIPTPTASTAVGTQIAVIRPAATSDDLLERDDWGTRILRVVEEGFISSAFRLTLLGYMPDKRDWCQQLQTQIDDIAHDLAGVICFVVPGLESALTSLIESDIPYITINRLTENSTDNFVMADNIHDGRRVGELFARLGFQRVLMLANNLTASGSALEKITGVLQAYLLQGKSTSGIELLSCRSCEANAGWASAVDYLKEHDMPQAIFCSGDLLAIGAMRACQEAGLQVPQDVAVVGSTGLEMAQYTQPPLSVLAQPMDEMGRQAARMLQHMIQQKTSRIPGVRIPGRFIVRESLSIPQQVRKELSL